MANTERANTITEVKNQVFVENIKGLFLMNGGGAIALTSWLQAVWEKEWAAPMLWWHLWGMACFAGGVFFAGLALLVRFLTFYSRKRNVPRRNWVWRSHVVSNFLSVLAFAVGAALIVVGGFVALPARR